MEFVIAALPIGAIVIGMAGFDIPSKLMAPTAWAAAFFSGLTLFSTPLNELVRSSWLGVMDGVRIVWLIFAAFTLLQIMVESGAMDTIKTSLAGVTSDRRLMVLLLAIPFGTFLEGAAGAGSPAALAAPFLVGLGMNPVVAASACLIGNSVPVSWGGAGATTVVGAGKFVDFVQASAMTGRMAALEYLVLPILMIAFVFGAKAIKGIWKDVIAIGVIMGSANFMISNVFISVTELTSLIGGIFGTAAFSLWLMATKRTIDEIPEKFRLEKDDNVGKISPRKFALSITPYLILCAMLVTVRLSVPLGTLASFGGGYTVWVGTVIMISAAAASIILGANGKLRDSISVAFRKVLPALLAMSFLMAMVNCMRISGQISILAVTLSAAAGWLYPMTAVLIGQIGGFVTGTNLGSNLMFNPLHIEAAKTLGMNPMTVVAAQNTGGAIGNMICPNNIVAVCACVGILGKEGKVMRKTMIPSLILMFFLGILALLYTYKIYPV